MSFLQTAASTDATTSPLGLFQSYENIKSQYEQNKSKTKGFQQYQEDLEDYKQRENNIYIFALIALFSLVLASIVLWWSPTPTSKTNSFPSA